MIYLQMESINKELEIYIFYNQIEILELNNTITKMKNSQEGLNNRFEQAKGKISELEDSSIKITQSEEQKVKRK